jgi:hypothetical protein
LRGAIEASARSFRMLMRLGGASVVFRDDLLIASQNVYSKSFAGMEMSMCSRSMIHTNQHQHRIERNGGEGIRRHTVHFAFLIDGNDGDSGCEASHRFAEVIRVKAHSASRRIASPACKSSLIDPLSTVPTGEQPRYHAIQMCSVFDKGQGFTRSAIIFASMILARITLANMILTV